MASAKDTHDDNVDDETKVDKHNWGAADLEKVTDVQEDRDDLKVSSDTLGKLINGQPQAQQKVVKLTREDVKMIMNALELPQTLVEKKLVEFNGDPRATMRHLLGM